MGDRLGRHGHLPVIVKATRAFARPRADLRGGAGMALQSTSSPASTGAAETDSRSASLMMRLIVATAWTGYSPTLVSADSISASAPSSTALATSDASARVGRGAEIIDSSIWVATMTGLAWTRARSTIRFWPSAPAPAEAPHRDPRGRP